MHERVLHSAFVGLSQRKDWYRSLWTRVLGCRAGSKSDLSWWSSRWSSLTHKIPDRPSSRLSLCGRSALCPA